MTRPQPEQLTPTTDEETRQCVLAALEEGEPLEISGGGTKRYYGRPVEAARRLSLSALSGIVEYLPHELILVVLPGTRLAEIELTLAGSGQMLAFDPPHWGESATIGGAVACNLSGPRRPTAGALRDHLLGFQAVTGRGELFRGGGRVVKNVTGYDLCKLMCGSFGTLAVFTELVLKVLPVPETERTVVVTGLSDAEGIALLTDAARSPHQVSGLAHLPPGLNSPEVLGELAAGGGALTLLRIEGPPPSVAFRCGRVSQLSGKQALFLEKEDSAGLWRSLRELEPLAPAAEERLWRLSVPPSEGAALLNQLQLQLQPASRPRAFFDWGGALLWCILPAALPAGRVHGMAIQAGGHAGIVKPGREEQRDIQVFSPLEPVKFQLHRNLKEAFDPNKVLNPGRMYAEF